MPNPLHNPFTPEHKLPKKRLFGGNKQERQPFAHAEESGEQEQDIENKLEGKLFEFHGFELNWESYRFMTTIEKQIKENQQHYPEEGKTWERKWTDEEIQEIVKMIVKYSTIKEGEFTVLYLDGVRLTELPDLPESLKHLTCADNNLHSMPDLPEGLVRLDCNNNQIAVLPELPKSLKILVCQNNQLTALPGLPDALFQIDCNGNHFPEKEQKRITKHFSEKQCRVRF